VALRQLGNVASVLIEKPPRGDFLPIVDGGYASSTVASRVP